MSELASDFEFSRPERPIFEVLPLCEPLAPLVPLDCPLIFPQFSSLVPLSSHLDDDLLSIACLCFFQGVQRYKVSAMVKDAKSHVARATVTSRRQQKQKCYERRSLKERLKLNLAGHTIDPRTHWMQRLKTNLAGHNDKPDAFKGVFFALLIMLRNRTVHNFLVTENCQQRRHARAHKQAATCSRISARR